MDAFGTEDEMAFPLELRDRLLWRDEYICFGLPVRGLPVIDDVLPETDPDLEGLALPPPLRSADGIVVFRLLAIRPPLAGAGIGLPLVPRLSSAALISGGMVT